MKYMTFIYLKSLLDIVKNAIFLIIFFNNNTNKFYNTRQYNVKQYIAYRTAYLH